MIRRIAALILALCLALPQATTPVRAAATLLPNGEQCFQATTPTSGGSATTGTGMVATLGAITAGTGGTAGTYGGIALTGGTGSGATANFTVAGGVVTAVAIQAPGNQYSVGDVLSAASASIGNVTGFSVPVASLAINSALAGGQVFFYQPNTAIFKQTWFNADQAASHQNTNPVKLDANGCAIIYGIGSYRQVLQDSLGNTIWDAITTDVSANNSTFWAGTASALGTPNAIAVSDPGFNATDGSIINFVPIATNTGPTTLNPCTTLVTLCFGAISVVKDTAAGPVALSGGEIAIAAGGLGNTVSVLYSASQNNFHLQNLIAAAVSAATPLCGAIGLKITNDTTFPNSKIVITADQINMQSSLGTYITRGSPTAPVSLAVNFTVNGANGIDTGTFAASSWYNIYAIDNGVAPAGLGSLSATAPTMPSGYSYKCRLGAASTDSSGNFFRTIQLGREFQYQVVTGSNTAALPVLASGIAGNTATGPTVAVPVTVAGACMPTTVAISLFIPESNNGASSIVAPNNAYAGLSSNTNPNPIASAGATISAWAKFNLESTNVFWASGNSGNKLFLLSCTDKVNAS